MAGKPAPEATDPVAAEEIRRLRARVEELERELRTRPASGPTPRHDGDGRMRVATGALAATTVVMAPAAFVTVRRWFQWWRR